MSHYSIWKQKYQFYLRNSFFATSASLNTAVGSEYFHSFPENSAQKKKIYSQSKVQMIILPEKADTAIKTNINQDSIISLLYLHYLKW